MNSAILLDTMIKPKPTRTVNPIHFEDLDPKRYEDLIRELIYDFCDWQTIEATGRGGDDQGFDIRAYERLNETVIDDEGVETVCPMDGNLWMIQGKREKEIGPNKLKGILEDVDEERPPYGYILAASANFSKKSFDTFREVLKKKSVMEFYLWGKPELEGMLHLPKNDRVLFTFFGISNVSRKRSRATEIRSSVTVKNRLFRVLGENPKFGRVLLRDSKDSEYPYKNGYKDFDERPRWKEYTIIDNHPLGLIAKIREHYAFYDSKNKEYDWAKQSSLVFRDGDSQEERQRQQRSNELARDFWESMPNSSQATFHKDGLIRYDSILVVDDKGDSCHQFPHLFVDFSGNNGPFAGFYDYLEAHRDRIAINNLREVDHFPEEFPEPKFGDVHDNEPMEMADMFVSRLRNYPEGFFTLYDCDGRYDHLAESDVALVAREKDMDIYIQITQKSETKVAKLLSEDSSVEWDLEQQLGRKPKKSESITILEFRRVHEHQFRKIG